MGWRDEGEEVRFQKLPSLLWLVLLSSNFTLPNINIVTSGSPVFLELFSLPFIYNFDFIASILHSFYFLIFSFSSFTDVS